MLLHKEMQRRIENRTPCVIEDVLLSTGAVISDPIKVLSCDNEWLEVYANEKVRLIAWAHIVHLTLRNM